MWIFRGSSILAKHIRAGNLLVADCTLGFKYCKCSGCNRACTKFLIIQVRRRLQKVKRQKDLFPRTVYRARNQENHTIYGKGTCSSLLCSLESSTCTLVGAQSGIETSPKPASPSKPLKQRHGHSARSRPRTTWLCLVLA